ncbi:MAG: PorP/SprF family type IX secretion system membrane protein [Cytophagales bacterium]|nr:PorP/SprF family type IX secretion system membrane protein [Cytophagales bacterium]
MYKLTYLLALLILASVVYAQPMNQYTQYLANPYMVNPAYAGAEEFTHIQASYRKQWMGVAGSPGNNYLSAHTRYKKEKKAEDYIERDWKPYKQDNSNYTVPTRGRTTEIARQAEQKKIDSIKTGQMQKELEYRKKIEEFKQSQKYAPHHGFGANVLNMSAGTFTRNSLYVSYAYHLWIAKKARLAMGGSLGFVQNSVNPVSGIDNDDQPLNTFNNAKAKMSPDLIIGGLLYSKTYFVGISGFALLPTNPYAGINENQKAAILGLAGYRININDDFSVTPSFLVRYAMGNPISIDVSAKASYKMIWLGATYRKTDAVAFMIGANFGPVDVSYSYDMATSVLSKYGSGGHEIILGYRLAKKKGTTNSLLFN